MMNHKYSRVKRSAGGAVAGIGQGISSIAPLLNFIPGVGQLASPIASTVGNFLTLFDNGEFNDLQAAAGASTLNAAPKTLADGGYLELNELSSDNISKIQRALSELKYNVGPIDGVYGPKTQAAYDRYVAARQQQYETKQKFLEDGRKPVADAIRDLTGVVAPTNANAYIFDLLGQNAPITNRDVSKKELDVLRQASRTALDERGGELRYPHYGNNKELEKIYFSPEHNMQTTIGEAKVRVNRSTGDTILTDRYNFNYPRNPGGLYGGLRQAGYMFGSRDGEGAPVYINTSRFSDDMQFLRNRTNPARTNRPQPDLSKLPSQSTQSMAKYVGYANGGHLPQQTDIAGLMKLNGPSHEQGGIPFKGVEVEGGETNWKNYVFSDRLKIKDA